MDELTGLTGESLDWVEANPERARARAVIIYAWDDVAEGGWLVPTHTEKDSRVKALGAYLRKRYRDQAVAKQ